MAEHRPTPWRVADIEHDYDIIDADGRVAAIEDHEIDLLREAREALGEAAP